MPDDTLATLPSRKRLNHRGPLSVDVSSAWYFITICADGHAPWVGSRVPRAREGVPLDVLGFLANIGVAARQMGGATSAGVGNGSSYNFVAPKHGMEVAS